MAVHTTTSNVNALLPDDYGPLVVQPALNASVFARIATTVTTSSTEYRIPIVAADPTASWVAEDAEITPSDRTLQELTVTPSKAAGLTITSRELADDSSPAAAQVVGNGLARDIARRIDQAAIAGLSAGTGRADHAQRYPNPRRRRRIRHAGLRRSRDQQSRDHGDRVCHQPRHRTGACHCEDSG